MSIEIWPPQLAREFRRRLYFTARKNADLRVSETKLKAGIHPQYQRAVVQCACGNTFETRSTLPEIHVEICAHCHPFFTGKQKLVDTAGRVERFRQRYAKKAEGSGE